jgi:2-polyprenyl-3-methyl-5-hydroxy-6-metoxy-1,4-benzoquinol methylase
MEAFDLVHARAVLIFLPQPAETISKMAAALKPGGCLLLTRLAPQTDEACRMLPS